MKRLGIYYLYDKKGIVDDYIPVLLKEANKVLDKLIIVVGGYINNVGIEVLNKHSNQIIYYNNCEWNEKAYLNAMLKQGWNELGKFDEIVLFDYLLYGPFYPLNIAFEEMKNSSIDFWGIFNDYINNINTDVYLNSSFIVIRRSVTQNNRFQEFCKNNKTEFNTFLNQNFIGESYTKTKDLGDYCNKPYIYYAAELIENRKCPFLFKKALYYDTNEHLDLSNGQNGYEIFNYIKGTKKYDSNLIWDNLLRTINMFDIKQCMQSNYILSNKVSKSNKFMNNRVALFIHIYYEELIEYCRAYAESMPEDADIYITTCNNKNKQLIEKSFHDCKVNKINVIVIENRGRDISSLLIGLRKYVDQYDIICFAHDKQAKQSKPYIIGESFSYNCYENILSSKEYVDNILITFQENQRLGLLTPPPPCHGPYYQIVSQEWQSNFTNTLKIANKLGINVDIGKDKPPIAPFGTMFWFRSKALKLLFDTDFKYDDFPEEPTGVDDGTIMHAIERIYSYVAQHHGYYVGWVMSDVFSKMYITNLNFYNQTFYEALSDKNKISTFNNVLNDLKESRHKIYLSPLSVSKKVKLLIRKTIGNDNYFRLWNLKTRIVRKLKGRIYK